LDCCGTCCLLAIPLSLTNSTFRSSCVTEDKKDAFKSKKEREAAEVEHGEEGEEEEEEEEQLSSGSE